MNRKIIGLLIIVALQISILIGEYVSSVLPLYLGDEIVLKTIPIDPRSLFRGNYVRLNYSFSRVMKKDIDFEVNSGDKIYLLLKDDGKFYIEDGWSSIEPEDGVYLKGRVIKGYSSRSNIEVDFGIEAFFMPKDEALKTEDQFRGGGYVSVMVWNGKARIKELMKEI